MHPANHSLETSSPDEIILWAIENIGRNIALSSSFQMQSLPLLHILSQTAPEIPVIFLDTGYHFPETLAFRDQLANEWSLNIKVMKADVDGVALAVRSGQPLYAADPDTCCFVNKVEPMQRTLKGLDGWISGIRRDQTAARANTQIIEVNPDNTVRIHPMATWTRQDIWQYINKHQLPEHPLFSEGYLSIGCAPCTIPIFDDSNERVGRWQNKQKTECGLHTTLRGSAVIKSASIEVVADEQSIYK